MRPNLGFEHDYQRRPQPPKNAAHPESIINWREENAFTDFPIRQFPARQCRGGKKYRNARMLLPQAFDQRCRREDFADGNRVKPDRAAARRVGRDESEALANPMIISAVANSPVE